jgi:hypothetical protein
MERAMLMKRVMLAALLLHASVTIYNLPWGV